MARSIQEVLDAVRAASTRTDSLIALLDSKKKQVEELLATQMTPEIQKGLDDIFDTETSDAQKLDAALNVGPDGAPLPAPAGLR